MKDWRSFVDEVIHKLFKAQERIHDIVFGR
jgi:hypothetical protein